MSLKAALLIIGPVSVVFYAIQFFVKRSGRRGRVSDDEFLEFFEGRGLSPDLVLRERRKIARGLSVPYDDLAPESSREELLGRYQFLGDVSFGWDDLEEELADWLGLEREEVEVSVVAEFIEGFAESCI